MTTSRSPRRSAMAQRRARVLLKPDVGLGIVGGEALQRHGERGEGHAPRDAELQARRAQLGEVARPQARRLRLTQQLPEMRLGRAPELGQVGLVALPIEERAAHLVLEQLDGPRQRGLRHVATLCRPREVERLREGHEVADLMHFHCGALPGSGCDVIMARRSGRHNSVSSTMPEPPRTIAAPYQYRDLSAFLRGRPDVHPFA